MRKIIAYVLLVFVGLSGCAPAVPVQPGVTVTPSNTTTPATTIQTTPATTNFTLQIGSFLADQQGVSSEVLLKNVQLDKGISDKVSWPPSQSVQMGDPIWVITGTVQNQNQHPQYKSITIYAYGYDDKGNVVAETLDSLHRFVVLELEKEETGQFTLHLNTAANLTSIHIFAHSYPIQPP